jgi:hypothetical protein
MTHRKFARPKSVEEYGFEDGRAVDQAGTPSGFLLPWEAIDDVARAKTEHRPQMLVVVGEWVREDGVRFPELVVSERFMLHRGYVRDGRHWVRSDA